MTNKLKTNYLKHRKRDSHITFPLVLMKIQFHPGPSSQSK